MLFSIALLTPPYTSLTYSASPWLQSFDWQMGLRVLVPLGKRLSAGVILKSVTKTPRGLKPILWALEKSPLLSKEHLNLIQELALRQAKTPGQILASILPNGLRITRLKFRLFSEGKVQIQSIKNLAALAGQEDQTLLYKMGSAWLKGNAEILAHTEDSAASEFCVLLADPPWAVRPTAHRQMAVLDFLLNNGNSSRRNLLHRLGSDVTPALATLVKNGLIALQKQEESDNNSPSFLPPPPTSSITFSEEQNVAIKSLLEELDSEKPYVHLLFGVTGSGKTAVYLELIRECLQRGRSAFLLAPEVALAYKLRRDVLQTLQKAPLYFFHGYQNASSREKTFRELAQRTEPSLIVGTRSALFLPVTKLGLIVLDEEHDSSFKQDEGLPYQAKEVAWFRTQQNGGLLLLGSATPDIKTYYAAKKSQIALSTLPKRVGLGTLPTIRLVNIATLNLQESLFAPESLTALQKTVKRGDQAVILLNRRGYSPLMYCLNCGQTLRCPNCDIGLTYHKAQERLVCHYCGYTVPFPIPCPHCKGLHYHPMGQGTEHIEEDLPVLLPVGSRVLRLDRDSTRRVGSMEEILESFAKKEAQVLIGTQMLSKGHHFPDVTLVIVLDADVGINLPDYRATERTFQLLVQSAGRSGRGEHPGEVIIQTRDPNFYCWNFVKSGDYEGLYNREIALRKKRHYPPFVKLALLRVNYSMKWKEGEVWVKELGKKLREKSQSLGVTLLGPAPSPLELLRGRKRFQFLLKAQSWQPIRELYTMIGSVPSQVRFFLDIDPVNML